MDAKTKEFYTLKVRENGLCGVLSADEESICIRPVPCYAHNGPRERLRLAIEGVCWFDYSDDDDVVQQAVDELMAAWKAWDSQVAATESQGGDA